MKLSCLPVSLYNDIRNRKMALEEWLCFAREIGLDATDLSVLLIPNRTPEGLKGIKGQMEDLGIRLTMLVSYPDFTNPDRNLREQAFECFCSDIAVADELNAGYIRATAGQNYSQMDTEETLKTVKDYLMRCREIADEHGIRLLIENHSKPAIWELEDFLYNVRVFLRLADSIRGTGIGINYDTANTWSYGGDAVESFKKVLPIVETIHISDMTKPLVFCEIGKGAAPIAEILSTAKHSGWDGWLCIEEASGNGKKGIKNAVDYIKRIWREI